MMSAEEPAGKPTMILTGLAGYPVWASASHDIVKAHATSSAIANDRFMVSFQCPVPSPPLAPGLGPCSGGHPTSPRGEETGLLLRRNDRQEKKGWPFRGEVQRDVRPERVHRSILRLTTPHRSRMLWLDHFPPRWIPARRGNCDKSRKTRACPD